MPKFRMSFISLLNRLKPLSLLGLFLITLALQIYPVQTVAAADFTAKWVDRSRIDITGPAGTATFIRQHNIYDEGYRIFGATLANCPNNDPSFIDVNAEGTSGRLSLFAPDGSGGCKRQPDVTVSVSDTSNQNKNVGLFKINDVSILALEAFTCNSRSGSTIEGLPVDFLGPKYYKKPLDDDPEINNMPDYLQSAVKGGNGYVMLNDDGSLNYDNFVISNTSTGSGDIGMTTCVLPGKTVRKTLRLADGGNISVPSWAPAAPANIDKKGATPGSSAANPQCQNRNPLDIAWWVCGALGAVDAVLTAATNAVDGLLTFNAEDFSENQELRRAWSYFRAVSSFALVLIMLVMVIGQSVGGE